MKRVLFTETTNDDSTDNRYTYTLQVLGQEIKKK